MTDDIALYFEILGEPATLDGQPVVGVFDNAYAEALGGMSTRQPRFRMSTEAAASVSRGSILMHDLTTYRVRVVEPDGLGTTTLMLELQP